MWSRIPLVRLVIPYVAGVLLAHCQCIVATPGIAMLWIPALLIISGGVFYGLIFSYRSRWLYGSFIIIFIFYCGYSFSEQKQHKRKKQLAIISQEEKIYLARLDAAFEMRARSCRAMVTIVNERDSLGWEGMTAKVMVYTEPDSSLLQVEAGTYLLLNAALKAVRPPANPGEFNFREYLAGKGIYHSCYLKKGAWCISTQSADFNLMRFASELRRTLLAKLPEHGIRGKYFGISSALLLGEDSHLDADIRDVYARAGAMHILCVSGLHVGVIFLVLSTILGFLKRFRLGKFMLPLLLFGSIWCYALITGLAPPVVRASCMISFFILGNAMGRQKNAYNTLAASALLMLLIDPSVLFGAGFQLSYSAVIGIMALQQALYRMFYFTYKLPDRIWSITAVSLAAQLGTLPVVLYYFHQFPLYSLITNLIVIPLSSLIIYAGMLLMIMPSLSLAANAAAWLLNALVAIMDAGVNAVEGIPYGLAEGIMTDLPMALMIALLICFSSLFLIEKKKAFLFISLSVLLSFSAYRLYMNDQRLHQKYFIVYAVNGHSAYDIIEGRSHTFIADSALMATASKLDYSIRPNWLDKGLDDPVVTLVSDTGQIQMLQCMGLRIAIWQGAFPRCHPPPEKLKLDYLILRGKCPFDMEDIFAWFDPEKVILDSSVPPWINAPEDDRRFWVCRERGAFLSSGCRPDSYRGSAEF